MTRSGRFVSTSMLNMHDEFYDHIRQFQFSQKKRGEVVFRFIPKDSCSQRVVREMRTSLMAKLGDDVDLKMEKVEEIPLTSRGKHRLLVQEMELKYDDASLEESFIAVLFPL